MSETYDYIDIGSGAGGAAAADFGRVRLSGAPAWWLWGLVHVFFLVGVRNRISVIWDWFWAYLRFRSGTRLITGELAEAAQPTAAELARIHHQVPGDRSRLDADEVRAAFCRLLL